MDRLTSLRDHVLIATPSVQSVMLQHALIYVCEHESRGSIGLIINRPTEYSVGIIFDHLHLSSVSSFQKNRPLLFGGPLQSGRGFVLHRPVGQWSSSLRLGADVTMTTSNDIIRALAKEEGPTDVLVTLGCIGFREMQLEKEIMKNHWLVCPSTSELLYDIPFEQRWAYAASTIGVNMDHLVEGSGHA